MTTRESNLTPTPDGLRHMREMFQETATKSQAQITHAELMLRELDESGHINWRSDSAALLTAALAALCDREYARIQSMNDGIAECTRGLGE